ncbi:hypothetical protein GCM10011491_30620 [Brucella endophytica]|uniref:Uncharacterized protein n=1 Tax=Brucella endophytica TaxID=1963359 RepID=A0A916WGZ3_9HYPH|nr:hypothetical protein [Brucella endophytica]GGB00311.1 hypothetical protein GCM10011491_30620 [Brucella endophytica]
MFKGNDSIIVVCIAAAGIGAFVALWLLDFALVRTTWCAGIETTCVREWIGALSGWAAAAGAAVTIYVLWATLQHMRHSSEAQLRAYVAEESVELTDTKSAFEHSVDYSIRNFGQTPARKLIVGTALWVGLPSDSPRATHFHAKHPVGLVVPDQPFSGSLQLRLSHDMVTAIFKTEARICFGITIRYETFGKTVQRAKLFVSKAGVLEDGPLLFTDEGDWNEDVDPFGTLNMAAPSTSQVADGENTRK